MQNHQSWCIQALPNFFKKFQPYPIHNLDSINYQHKRIVSNVVSLQFLHDFQFICFQFINVNIFLQIITTLPPSYIVWSFITSQFHLLTLLLRIKKDTSNEKMSRQSNDVITKQSQLSKYPLLFLPLSVAPLQATIQGQPRSCRIKIV